MRSAVIQREPKDFHKTLNNLLDAACKQSRALCGAGINLNGL